MFIRLLLCLVPFFGYAASPAPTDKIVRIYCWAHYIPAELLKKFEKETGIKVQYTVFESQESLDAALLSASSGYDVVFPSAFPTLAQLIPAGAFERLDLQKIPNAKALDPEIMRKLASADPENLHAIPYTWGVNVLVYDKKKVEAAGVPPEALDSWGLLLNPAWVALLKPLGVTLFDSPVDLLPMTFLYLGKDPNTRSLEDLQTAKETLQRARPFIKEFDSALVLTKMLNGSINVAATFSTYACMIQEGARQEGREIVVVIPKEGAMTWIDAMAIPKGSKNPEAAHTFINFMLRPENIALVTNTVRARNAVSASDPFIDPALRDNPVLYPPLDVMKRLYVDKKSEPKYMRSASRVMVAVKTGA